MPIKNKVCHEYPLTVKLEYMAAHGKVFRNMRLGIEAEALYTAAGLDPYKRSAALNYQN